MASAPDLIPVSLPKSPVKAGDGQARVVGRQGWSVGRGSLLREYGEVIGVIAAVTVGCHFVPLSYHTFGLIYLLVVIALSLRVGRWPVLAAAVISALAWVFVFMPPRFSFVLLESADGLLIGTYLVVALVAGQLTSQIRMQERQERLRERRATALFDVTRAIAEARTLDEAVGAALRQADSLFSAQTGLLLAGKEGKLTEHAAGSLLLTEPMRRLAEWVSARKLPAGRFTEVSPDADSILVPLLRAETVYGVFVVHLPEEMAELPPVQRDLIDGFAAQIALLVEREELREASEREKLLAASDRMHRTLLDSVSHELKTPLAVLRSAGDKLDTEDAGKRANLVGEIRTATRRLDHLVGNLLSQTRLESGVLRPQLDWCDVRDLITAARRATSDALVGRPITIQIPPDMPLVMADAPLMEQVIGNLLLNAALHTPAGSPITLTTGLEIREGHEQIFLRIEDRGLGLPAELRGRLFQKFQRGQRARTGGLGLGLAIARGFMLAQGGDIAAGDNPDGGARFTLYLPLVLHEGVPNDER